MSSMSSLTRGTSTTSTRSNISTSSATVPSSLGSNSRRPSRRYLTSVSQSSQEVVVKPPAGQLSSLLSTFGYFTLQFTTSEDEDDRLVANRLNKSTTFYSLRKGVVITRVAKAQNDAGVCNTVCNILRRTDESIPPHPTPCTISTISPTDAGLRITTCPEGGAVGVRVNKGRVVKEGWELRSYMGSFLASNGPGQKDENSASLFGWPLSKSCLFQAGNTVFTVTQATATTLTITTTPIPPPAVAPPPDSTTPVAKSAPPSPPTTFTVTSAASPYVIGRATDADLTVPDRELSRRHLGVCHGSNLKGIGGREVEAFYLVDLGSTNGTFMRLEGPYEAAGTKESAATTAPWFTHVRPGTEFLVGRTGFVVHRFGWGGSEAIGARRTMEDRVIVRESLLYDNAKGNVECDSISEFSYGRVEDTEEVLKVLEGSVFCAVCDGHGGGECSEYLADVLADYVREGILKRGDDVLEALEEIRNGPERGFRFNEEEFHGRAESSPLSSVVRGVLKDSFLKCDADFINDPECPSAGSTCASFLMMGNHLFAANVGDSRVVLCRGSGVVIEMTSDHKPTRADEAARIKKAGGFVLHRRVMGELAISRAFGDKGFKRGIKEMLEEDGMGDDMSDDEMDDEGKKVDKDKDQPLVIAEPEITELDVNFARDEFLLVACDGLFDVFTSADAVAYCREKLIELKGRPSEVAEMLSNEAITVRRSRDNVSIVIILLRNFWEELEEDDSEAKMQN